MTKHGKSEAGEKRSQDQKETTSSTNETSGKESVQISRSEYEELLKKAEEFAQLQDRLLRSAADFDNAKKRLTKEREEFLKFAIENLIYDLLPVLDHLELALAHLDAKDEKIKSIRDGFLLIQRQLLAILAGHGVKRVEAFGKHFDPHVHEAVSHIITHEQPEGTIVEEILPGYELNGKLLRPAKVKISTKTELPSKEKTEELT
ncbi:MAG: nucleotide exchange factor GrpE [Omnitrophica bacterium RIFCSPHIGHO2_02_FULL_46_11]|nr:MAG: nucleotide exchange factor GrpE [Omnitrophica bacterium RIFCSPHIGHO2_02_FULL_46_11]